MILTALWFTSISISLPFMSKPIYKYLLFPFLCTSFYYTLFPISRLLRQKEHMIIFIFTALALHFIICFNKYLTTQSAVINISRITRRSIMLHEISRKSRLSNNTGRKSIIKLRLVGDNCFPATIPLAIETEPFIIGRYDNSIGHKSSMFIIL